MQHDIALRDRKNQRWEDVGSADVYMLPAVSTQKDDEEPDMTEPMVQVGLVHMTRVQGEFSPEEVLQAIRDTFTKNDCDHEYDCCGCRSFVARAEHIAGPVFKVTIGSSRNF